MSDPAERYPSGRQPEHVAASPATSQSDDQRQRANDFLRASSPAEMTAQAARVNATGPDDGASSWRTRLAPFAAISLGGMLGANARFLVSSLIGETSASALPWGTLFANVTGCFLIGLYLTLATERLSVHPTTRLFFVTGCLGSYTTFSIFSYETIVLVQRGASMVAVAYVVGSLLLGYLAVVAGTVLARTLYRAGDRSSVDRGTDSRKGR